MARVFEGQGGVKEGLNSDRRGRFGVRDTCSLSKLWIVVDSPANRGYLNGQLEFRSGGTAGASYQAPITTSTLSTMAISTKGCQEIHCGRLLLLPLASPKPSITREVTCELTTSCIVKRALTKGTMTTTVLFLE